MKGWRATVLCRLDCAIKMKLRVVAIKVSRCQHGKFVTSSFYEIKTYLILNHL